MSLCNFLFCESSSWSLVFFFTLKSLSFFIFFQWFHFEPVIEFFDTLLWMFIWFSRENPVGGLLSIKLLSLLFRDKLWTPQQGWIQLFFSSHPLEQGRSWIPFINELNILLGCFDFLPFGIEVWAILWCIFLLCFSYYLVYLHLKCMISFKDATCFLLLDWQVGLVQFCSDSEVMGTIMEPCVFATWVLSASLVINPVADFRAFTCLNLVGDFYKW